MKHQAIIIKLVLLIIGMFGFTFALIPLYTVFCKITGINGKVDTTQASIFSRYENDQTHNRLITVEFVVNRNRQLPCEFSAAHTALQIRLGNLTSTAYTVKNLTSKKMIIQAIPSISPGIAAKHLKKLECFCFNKQILNPGETQTLPVRFWVEPDIPSDIHRLTLSYTLFDVTDI